jgi:hypothetical protein
MAYSMGLTVSAVSGNIMIGLLQGVRPGISWVAYRWTVALKGALLFQVEAIVAQFIAR